MVVVNGPPDSQGITRVWRKVEACQTEKMGRRLVEKEVSFIIRMGI